MDGITTTSKLTVVQSQRDKAGLVSALSLDQAADNSRETSSDAVTAVSPANQTGDAVEKSLMETYAKAAEALAKEFGGDIARSKLQIDHDEDSGRFVYKAVDIDTGEVTYQFPAEEMLKILSYYRDDAAGLVVDSEA